MSLSGKSQVRKKGMMDADLPDQLFRDLWLVAAAVDAAEHEGLELRGIEPTPEGTSRFV